MGAPADRRQFRLPQADAGRLALVSGSEGFLSLQNQPNRGAPFAACRDSIPNPKIPGSL